MKWRDCRALIRSDIERMRSTVLQLGAVSRLRKLNFLLMPEITALALYRISHMLLRNGRPSLAAFVYRFNITLTGADIHPTSEIGPRCLLVHPVGTVIHGRLGADVTLYARVLIEPEAMGAAIEITPRLADGVVMGSMSSVLGPVEIAPNVHIAPGSLIERSIAESDCLVSSLPGERMMIVKNKHEDAEK